MSLIAINDAPNIAGRIVWWRLSGVVEFDTLCDAWVFLGLPEKLLPHRSTPEKSLQRAMREHAAKRRLVRPLGQGVDGYALVDEEAKKRDLVHAVELRAEVVYEGDDSPCAVVRLDPPDHHLAAAISQRFTACQDELDPTQFSTWVATRIIPWMAAVPLRDRGGFYFIMADYLDQWSKFAQVVREVSDHKIYQIPALRSEEAVEAVLDAVTSEAAKTIDHFEEILATGNVGRRAFHNRARDCGAMLAQLERYEELLGSRMDDVKARVEDLQCNLTAAACAIMAEEKEEEEEES